MACMSTPRADAIFESDIHISHLIAASIRFTIVVTPICPMLTTILLDISVNGVEVAVDVLGGISKDSSNLLIRQQRMPIRY